MREEGVRKQSCTFSRLARLGEEYSILRQCTLDIVRRVKVSKELWCCVGGGNKVISLYQLS